MKIIALTGPKGVGKSFTARKLCRQAEGDAVIASFSTPIKRMAEAILPPESFTVEAKEDPNAGICGVSPRRIFQTLGTEWGRNLISPDIWVAVMARRLNELALGATRNLLVVIDDLRFENEAQLIKSMGGEIHLVKRAGVDYTETHQSEIPLPAKYLDGIILNEIKPTTSN
jgi:hypothetical protein